MKACHSAIDGKYPAFCLSASRLGEALRRSPVAARQSAATRLGEARAARRRLPSAFSLIEVLVAMAVMIVIVVMVTNMFRDASEAWDMGTQRADMNTSARAAMEYMARELSCAMAGSITNASQNAPLTLKKFKLEENAADPDKNVKDLSFAVLSGENQTLRGIRFRYNSSDRTVEYTRQTGSFTPYDPTWGSWPNTNLMITNVWRFQATICSNEGDMMNGGVGYSYDSSEAVNSNLLPACVDISIEMLGERDMARALGLEVYNPSLVDGFVMTNSRVYTTRVCFPNRGSR